MNRAALALAFLLACQGGSTDPATGPEVDTDVVTADIPADVGAVVDPSGLVRRLRAVGPGGQVPDSFVVHLGDNHFRMDQVGQVAPAGTELVFDPAVSGRIEVSARDTLRFVPEGGFLPGTAYAVEVKAIGLEGETRPAPAAADWKTTFTTVPFQLHRMSLQNHDLSDGELEVDLVFTAPVEADAVEKLLTFRMGTERLSPKRVVAGSAPNEVRAAFRDTRLRQEGTLSVLVAAGVPYAPQPTVKAPQGAASMVLRGGQPVEILAVQVKEGMSGHYLDVVCKDEAVEDERYWWDPDTYDGWWVSNRCMIDQAEVAQRIRVVPEVELTVAQGPAGFRLFGDFPRGDYTVELDAGLETIDGGVVKEAWRRPFTVTERSPRLSFASKGRYLPRSAWDSMAVSHLNVDEVDLEIRHVPPENLVFWLSGDERLSARTADLVLDTKIQLKAETDVEETTWVDVARLLPEVKRGVYEVRVDAGSARDASRILLTDMHLIVKQAEKGPAEDFSPKTWVWALGVHDNRLMSGVDVDLVAPSGRVLDTCRTDGSGGCVLEPAQGTTDKVAPVAVVASRADDLTYVKFSELEVVTEDDTSGESYRSKKSVRAAVYSDRGVYRPGDTAHVAALVRDAAFLAPKAGLPAVLKLYDPRGKELRRTVLETSSVGFLTHDLTFADFATTGSYRVSIEVADQEVGTLGFAVEEFVPERMKVEATANQGGSLPREPVAVDISGRWLFGGTAEDARVEVTCELVATPFKPAGNRNFHYGLAFVGEEKPRPVTLGTLEDRLGEGGTVQVDCPASSQGSGTMGSGLLKAHVAVFEGESGRTTNTTATAPVHPERFYLGTQLDADVAKRGQVLALTGVVVDWEGKTLAQGAPAQVEIDILRLEEEVGWSWDEEEGTSRYRRILRRVNAGSQTVDVSQGSFSLKYKVDDNAAGYLFVAHAGDARTEQYVEGSGRRYWWEPGEDVVDQTPRPQKPGSLELKVASSAKVDDQVAVSATAPYPGRLLWTLETEGVLRHEWQTVKAGAVSWSFAVKDYVPNAYVSALLIKDPHAESADSFMPDRAYGVQSVRIEPVKFTQQVTLSVPEEVRPYGPLEVQLDLGKGEGPRVATVAVVDEGILQLTRFKTPDPLDTIFARRALGVDSFETVGWTLLVPPGGAGRTTGGDADGGGGRVQMVKPVALWSGEVEVPESGKVTVPFEIPGYRGQLRVMAVVAGKGTMGSAEASVLVRDPLVLQATLPRFLLGGDEADIPVFVSNMSGADRQVTVSLEVEEFGPMAGKAKGEAVRITSPLKATLRLADGESGTALFQVQVGRAPTSARFKVFARADGLESREELEVPLLPKEPEARQIERVALTSGVNDLDRYLEGWVEGSDQTTFWVTANPYAESLTHLRYLVRYPYGCIEQTTSSTRPLLYVSNLVGDLDPELLADNNVDEMVAHGIERVLSMQTPSGGFGYWPGSDHPNAWGTAYGTHMLLDAKDAGHEVPARSLEDALTYLRNEVASRGGDSERTTAYAHYVLARGGKGLPAQAQAELEQLPKDDAEDKRYRRFRNYEARYLLMAAMYLGGDRRHEADLKKLDAREFELARTNDWSFYSELRARGLVLSVFGDLFGADEAGAALADRVALSTSGRASRWYTTQELAWAVTGLGKRVAGAQKDVPEAELKIDGKVVSPRSGAGKGWSRVGAAAADDVQLTAKVSASQPLWLVLTTRGVRKSRDLPAGGEGLAVSRRFLTADQGATKAQDLGDTVYVELTLVNRTGRQVQNVAMVDRIPAGWEIENPRLGRGSLPDWVNDNELWQADHMNVRDDRVEVFGTLRAGETRRVIYQVRAVTAGTFAIPEVSVEAMYDPGVWARSYGETVTIDGPWDGSVL